MSLVKVSVENLEASDRVLYEIDKSKTLQENIRSVCKLFSKPIESDAFGLKLLSTNDGKSRHTYISADNFDEIKDGYFLKLAYSVNYYVKRIFEHIDDDFKEQSFKDLHALSFDPEFIKELVRSNKHLVVIEIFTWRELLDTEVTACLLAILHLFSKGYISQIEPELLDQLLRIIKAKSSTEQIKYTLSILHRILSSKEPTFDPSKEKIIMQLPMNELMPLAWMEHNQELQFGTLLVANAIIKCCKGEKQVNVIKELNRASIRTKIFKHVIEAHANHVAKHTARELYILQTHFLSLYAETLNTMMAAKDLQRQDSDIADSELHRMTTLMDFDEDLTKTKAPSIENLLDFDQDARFSLASVTSSKYSEDESIRNTFPFLDTTDGDTNNVKMSLLTSEAYNFYKEYHPKHFRQSQIEEKVYGPGILITSEVIMNLLAKLLCIGRKPDRNSTTYQPIVFGTSSPFLMELFCRAMWLLSRTRTEMKASTLQDYRKVLHILEKQLKLVLDEKPITLKTLTGKMAQFNYDFVMKQWQRDKEEEMERILKTHPSVQVVKKKYIAVNKELVYKKRINFLQTGTRFPKMTEKKLTGGQFHARLSTHCRELIVQDLISPLDEPKSYPIANITHIVEGKACPHVVNNLTKEPQLAFSVIVNNSDYINFIAADRLTACYWVDTLNLLLDKDVRTEAYNEELQELVKMDLVLHLMELQNVALPKQPPPIPPNPFLTKPPVAAKPQM